MTWNWEKICPFMCKSLLPSIDTTLQMIKQYRLPLLFLCLLHLAAAPAQADVRVPGFYTNHMVLQRDVPIRLRGWAKPGEQVDIQLGDVSVSVKADASGVWRAILPEQEANSTGQTLVFKSSNTIVLKDILVGEVWLCSGQSNMEWTVAASQRSEEEIEAANHPLIRHIKVPRRPSNDPMDDIEANWEVCTPETVGRFTACGYFMARHLQSELNVPIGLINSSWGGTRVEPWTPTVGFESIAALDSIHSSVTQRTPGTPSYQSTLEEYIKNTGRWLEKAEVALKNHTAIEESPGFPEALKPFESHQDPTMLYNGMIHALVGYPIRGAIWYQGESNHTEGMLYYEKKKALIGGWRQLWGLGDFPFYYVQIAPFQYGNENPSILPEFWESQEAVEQLSNTAMVVINDIATLQDIHPPNKQDVGKRLAFLALKRTYGFEDLVAERPIMKSYELDSGKLSITFQNTGGGLKTRDGAQPNSFELVGIGSRGYHPAEATISGDTIVLSSEAVSEPVAFRFAWNKLSEPNLMGATGLPVGAFRGGKELGFLEMINIEQEYRLVYDLDLSTLGSQIRYQVDDSNSISEFDRVGYLIEFDSQERGQQKLFVSMNAFTTDAKKIGIPTAEGGVSFQQMVKDVTVFSNVSGLVMDSEFPEATLEFWPNNYATDNEMGIPAASGSLYDFGDKPVPPFDGYGSMQVHIPSVRQTLFSINHWGVGEAADLGIGNSPGQHPDWTFSSNAKEYRKKRLRIYVRETN